MSKTIPSPQSIPAIPVYMRSVYGCTRIYIADEEKARHIRTLTNRDTLTATDLTALKALGFTFEQVPDPSATLNSFAG